MRDPNCAVWDSYIGECDEWRAAEWWEYVNVLSIAAVFGVIAALIIAVMVVGRWLG